MALAALEGHGDRALAASIEDVLLDILQDMDHEESEVLMPELLGYDLVEVAAHGG